MQIRVLLLSLIAYSAGFEWTSFAAEAEQASQATSSVESSRLRSESGVRFGFHTMGNLARTITSAEVDGKNLSLTGSPQPGFGLGASLGWKISWFSLESGLGWERRSQMFSGVWNQSDFLQIPLVAYIHPLSWFSFGAGMYYGYRFAQVLAPQNGTVIGAHEDAGFRSNHDVGLVLATRFEGELSPSWGLYGEARGAMSAVSVESLPGVLDRWEAIQLLVGLSWYP